MRFKQFLLNEESSFADSGSDWFYGNMLFPSDAGDWPYAQPYPSDFTLLQSRWQKERDEWGRKFYNLDVDKVLKTKYTAVYSNTMPDADGGFWKHDPTDRPNLKIDNDAKLEVIGVSKRADVSSIIYKSNDLIDDTDKLNKTFGELKPTYYDLPTNFDEPWNDKQGTTKMKYKPKKKYGFGINNF